MPKTPAAAASDNGSFDDLLGDPITQAEKENLADLEEAAAEVEASETPEQLRIRQLESQISLLMSRIDTAPAVVEPVEKTDAEKNEQHRQAVVANKRFLSARESFESVNDDDDVITFHFVSSGLTFAGRVWWIGQNVKVKRNGKAYKDTLDRYGNSWLDDLSVGAQYRRFGKQWVAEGEWQGPVFDDAVSAADAARGNAAPYTVI